MKKPESNSHLKYYNNLKSALISYFEESKIVLEKLSIQDQIWFGIIKGDNKKSKERLTNNLESLYSRLKDSDFRIIVVGRYNSGKSTVINALLKRKILPMDHRPATDIITEINFGKQEKIGVKLKENKGLMFQNSISKVTDADLKTHIINYSQSSLIIPPYPENDSDIFIESKHLEGIASIPEKDKGKKKENNSVFEKVELFIDNELLENQLVVTDTPGNEIYNIHNSITQNYIEKADLVLLLFNSHDGLDGKLMDDIKNEYDRFGKNVFIVATLIDKAYDYDDSLKFKKKIIKEKKEFILEHIGDKIDKNRVFLISAKIALKNYLSPKIREHELLEAELFEEFRSYFESFLTKNALINKIQASAVILSKKMENVLKEIIPNEKRMLTGEIEDIIENTTSIIERINHAKELLEDDILDGINREMGMLKDITRESVKSHLIEVEKEKVSSWTKNFNSGGTPSELHNVFSSYIRRKVKSNFEYWCESELESKLNENMESNSSYLNEAKLGRKLDRFFEEKYQIEGLVNKTSSKIKISEEQIIRERKLFFDGWKLGIARLSGNQSSYINDYSVSSLIAESITKNIIKNMPFDRILNQEGFYILVARAFEWLKKQLDAAKNQKRKNNWWNRMWRDIRDFFIDLFEDWAKFFAEQAFEVQKEEFIKKIQEVFNDNRDRLINEAKTIVGNYSNKMYLACKEELFHDLEILEAQAIEVKKNAELGKERVESELLKVKDIEKVVSKLREELKSFISKIK